MEGVLPVVALAGPVGSVWFSLTHEGRRGSTPSPGDSGLGLQGVWTQSRGSLWVVEVSEPRMGPLHHVESCRHIRWGPGLVVKVIMGVFTQFLSYREPVTSAPPLVLPSSYCSLLSGPVKWETSCLGKKQWLFRKPADWEEGGLMSQRTHITQVRIRAPFILKEGHVTGCWKLLAVGILCSYSCQVSLVIMFH